MPRAQDPESFPVSVQLHRTLNRRTFLSRSATLSVGAGLAASGCGVFDSGTSGGGGGVADGPQIVPLFSSDRVLAAGSPQRISFGILNDGIPLQGESKPYPVRILSGEETVMATEVAGRVVSHDHQEGQENTEHEHASILRYYALRATLPEPGIYDLEIDLDGRIGRLPFQIFDPSEVRVLGPGDPFPPILSPTVTESGTVDPICTLQPEPCQFHGQTAAAILGRGEPMAYLVATPAFCRTQYCGPGLQVLIDTAPDFPSVNMVHQEVYENARAVGGNIDSPDILLAPQLAELGLEFEPSLFLVDSSGIIADRIDNVFDSTELQEALERLI